MRESTTTGMISLDGPGGLVYEVGAITYLVREDESFRYTFVPNWPVIDLLEPPLFQGVPGYEPRGLVAAPRCMRHGVPRQDRMAHQDGYALHRRWLVRSAI